MSISTFKLPGAFERVNKVSSLLTNVLLITPHAAILGRAKALARQNKSTPKGANVLIKGKINEIKMKIQKSIIILIMSKANLRLPPRVILERSEESRFIAI